LYSAKVSEENQGAELKKNMKEDEK